MLQNCFSTTGANGEITYEIPQGIADDKFTVDSMTGVILTTARLDREIMSSYLLTGNDLVYSVMI